MSSVLIVENNSFFRESFREILRMYLPELSIEESADGNDLSRIFSEKQPDIVFMDIRLPGKNGLELTREIKATYPGVVVGVFTNYNLPEYRETAYRCGADHFLLKDSLSGVEVAALIQSVLSRKKITVH